MSALLKDLCSGFEILWPLSGAEDWDRPGLTTGSLDMEVKRVLLVIDVTRQTIQEAIDHDCQLILSHHPVLLKPVSFLSEESLKGSLISLAIKNSIAIYSAHTNADIVSEGVSMVFAESLGLKNIKPLVVSPTDHTIGHGRVGDLPKAISLEQLAEMVSDSLTPSHAPVRVAGERNQTISRVGLVGGAGDSFLDEAIKQNVDCFITSDLRHHVVLDALGANSSSPLSIIDVSHFGAESLWLVRAAKQLSAAESDVEFRVSKINTDPWSFTLPGKAKG